MQNIVKLSNGYFFALASAEKCEEYKRTGCLPEWASASLIAWDGKRGTAYPFTIDPESNFEYYSAADNTVYYTDRGGKNARIWCGGSRLSAHCHRLHQIAHRYTTGGAEA